MIRLRRLPDIPLAPAPTCFCMAKNVLLHGAINDLLYEDRRYIMRLLHPLRWRVPVPSLGTLSKMDFVLLLAVIGSVCLDVLTNVTAYAGVQSPVVAMLKGSILILIIGSYRTLYSYLITLAFFAIFSIRELLILVQSTESYLMEDAVFFLRILFFVSWLMLFYERRNRTEFLQYVLYVVITTAVISVACQLAGFLLGIDFFKAYGDQRGGYKGLFFAENDTSVFYLPVLIYAMYLWKSGSRLFTLIILAGLIFLGMGSKTALLGAVVVPVIYFYFTHDFSFPVNLKRLSLRPRPLIYGGIFFVTAVAAYLVISFYLSGLLAAFNYDQLIRVYEQSGLLSSLLSFRDLKVALYFKNIYNFSDFVFGLQIAEKIDIFGLETPGTFMYEIDFFDYLGRVGMLGLLLTVFTIWRNAGLRHWRLVTPELKTLVISIVILGLTVGHTLVSAMNGVWLGFWLILFGQLYSSSVVERSIFPVHGSSPS